MPGKPPVEDDYDDEGIDWFSPNALIALFFVCILVASISITAITQFAPDNRSIVEESKLVEMFKSCENANLQTSCRREVTASFKTK